MHLANLFHASPMYKLCSSTAYMAGYRLHCNLYMQKLPFQLISQCLWSCISTKFVLQTNLTENKKNSLEFWTYNLCKITFLPRSVAMKWFSLMNKWWIIFFVQMILETTTTHANTLSEMQFVWTAAWMRF